MRKNWFFLTFEDVLKAFYIYTGNWKGKATKILSFVFYTITEKKSKPYPIIMTTYNQDYLVG